MRECFGRCPDNIVLQEPDQLEVDVGETPGEGANGHRVHPRRVRPTFSSADPERSPRSTIRLLALRSGGARLKHLALLAAGCTGKRAGCRLEPAPGTLSPRDRVCTSSCSCSTVEEPSSSTTGGGHHSGTAKDPRGASRGHTRKRPRDASRGKDRRPPGCKPGAVLMRPSNDQRRPSLGHGLRHGPASRSRVWCGIP